jgi:group I intron endonuclease
MIIYKIENKINGKIYIGQTKRNLSKRISEHIGKDKMSIIGKALIKYGLQSFIVSIIDYAKNGETLSEKEKYWIKFYNSIAPDGYNLTEGGEGTKGHRHSPETRQKLSEINSHRSIETRQNISKAKKGDKNPMYGKRHTEEEKQHLSLILSGANSPCYGKHPSEETLQKMRQRKQSKETRLKLSIINKGKFQGEKHPNYGKHLSEDAKRRISEANTGRYHSEETKQRIRESLSGEKNVLFGKHQTIETKKKISLSLKKYWLKNQQRTAACA